jgi:hypothetical protein
MQFGDDPGDLRAAEIEHLDWLSNSPVFDAVVIADNGLPAKMAVPDPRYFAAHKLALSRRTDREAIKKHRDARQAREVIRLTAQYFPQMSFADGDLQVLPRSLRTEIARLAEAFADDVPNLPPDF